MVLAAAFTTLVCAGVEVWLIGYTGRLVDTLARETPGAIWARHGSELLAVAGLVLIVRPGINAVGEALDDIAFRGNARPLARWRAHRHVARQSVGWFRAELAGRVATWVRDGGDAASTAAYCVLHTLLFVVSYIAGSVWVMSAIDVRLLVPLGAWIAAYAGLMWWAVPRYRRRSEQLQEAESELTGLLVDAYANVETMALLGAEQTGHDRAVFARARRAHLDLQRVEVTINASMMALGSGLLVGLVGYGIVLWQGGAAPIGLVAAALALSFRITSMAEWLLDAVSALFSSAGALRKALQTVAQPLAVEDGELVLDETAKGAVRFDGVGHRHGLHGISLDIAAGERVGIVGRSGAGKSTLVGLLMRFHDTDAGTITVDGVDIRAVTQDSLRARIGMVGQDATLLHRSIRENIAGPGDADPGRVREALRRAAADGFVDALPQGAETVVGERGVRLSGGQRQRIALARAFYRDAPILVLDEATSALDAEAEAAVYDTLGAVLAGRTCIAISHRLATIARMDRIVVLDGGRIAEEGSHGELIGRRGLYAELWQAQNGQPPSRRIRK
ncbi:ABC transporter ATP-binding protein [Dactylosporangium sp. CS-033363]|uniref:ABC transporter ATP-binding protein n=1 Tax=Dactylosporangium sp. CS-033363 TaxID=3239935 RepID=UPI003D94DBB9